MRRPIAISTTLAIALGLWSAHAVAQVEEPTAEEQPRVAAAPEAQTPARSDDEPPADEPGATTTTAGGPATTGRASRPEARTATPRPRRARTETEPAPAAEATEEPDEAPTGPAPATPSPEPAPVPSIAGALACVAPTDVGGTDAVLARAESPLAGHGADFVRSAADVGLDPRFLVAVAAHETILMRYGPARLISNPFGLGPGWSFRGATEAIETAATVLLDGYLSEGLTTIPAIGAKWAPIGAGNDPTNLNSAWPAGVSRFYGELGGDPSREVLLSAQSALPSCSGAAGDPASSPEPAGEAQTQPEWRPGPIVITAWDGSPPRPVGPGPAGGHDPEHGGVATVAGFVFPVAARVGASIAFRDPQAEAGGAGCGVAGGDCTVRLGAGPGAIVVASRAGTVVPAALDEQEAGIGFWIQPETGKRVGYGPLAAYADGIEAGTRVRPGDVLGASGEATTFALEQAGVRINPYPLLAATRPPA